jgi:hypothetical protein
MDKLKVFVGLVYTQLMFCDEHGKLQFHRVMTDVDRPWLSIMEVLRMVKQALFMDKPIDYNFLIQSVHIDIQYRKNHFASILETLREKMERYLSEDCKLSVRTTKDYYEFVGETAEEKVHDWEASVWEFSPLEAVDHNKEPDSIQVLGVQKEGYAPLIYTDHGVPMRCYEPYEPFKGRIMSCELLLEDRISILSIDGGRSNWKKENNLRGSPNVGLIYFRKEEGGPQPKVNKLVFAGHRPTMSLFFVVKNTYH